jgi:hypothetical protein
MPSSRPARSGDTPSRSQTPGQAEGTVATGLADRPAVEQVERAQQRQPTDLRDGGGERADEQGAAARRHTDDAGRSLVPVPFGQHSDDGPDHCIGDLGVLLEDLAKTLSPPEIAQPREGSAGRHRLACGDPALDRDAQSVHPHGPLGPRLDGDADPGQLGAGGTEGGVGDIRGIPGGGAGVTAPAVGRGRVVQAALQEGHPALVARS